MATPEGRCGQRAAQPAASSAVGQGLQAGWRLGAATLDATWALTAGAATTLPRLLRLELVRPETRVSLGCLLDERAEGHPGAVGFLWEDRAHTHAALKTRIDAVVAGLLSVGVRQGESVGVLMDTRPSMLIAVAALNRIGAVVVLLRPDGSLAEEIKLGGVARIVTDPEHVDSVRAQTDAEVFVLGGGGGQRDLGVDGVIDLERIDPAAVMPPDLVSTESRPGARDRLRLVHRRRSVDEGAKDHQCPLGAGRVRNRGLG